MDTPVSFELTLQNRAKSPLGGSTFLLNQPVKRKRLGGPGSVVVTLACHDYRGPRFGSRLGTHCLLHFVYRAARRGFSPVPSPLISKSLLGRSTFSQN